MSVAQFHSQARWGGDEYTTCANLYEQGVDAQDIAQTLNRLYSNGRTATAVRKRMWESKVVWGCNARGFVSPAALKQSRIRREYGRKGAEVRKEIRAAAERAPPYHPLHDNARLLAILNHTEGHAQ